jgi:hypothetical protein
MHVKLTYLQFFFQLHIFIKHDDVSRDLMFISTPRITIGVEPPNHFKLVGAYVITVRRLS